MRILPRDYVPFNLSWTGRGFKTWRLRTKLLVALIPSVVFILALTGYITMWFSNRYLNEAIERNVKVNTVALAHKLELFFSKCRQDLLIIAQKPIARPWMVDFLESSKNIRGVAYRELAYVSQKRGDHIFTVVSGNDVSIIPAEDVAMISPSPFLFPDNISQLKKGEVWISDIIEVVYPSGSKAMGNRKEPARIIRFVTPCFDEDNSPKGFLLLSVDARYFLKLLSQINSQRSPVFAHTGGPGQTYCYLFDKEGSILFHSQEATGTLIKKQPADPEAPRIEGAVVRSAGLGFAFRPSSIYKDYWKIVKEVCKGKHGAIKMIDLEEYRNPSSNLHFHGYAPIHFNISSDRKPIVFGGVILVKRSNLTLWAGYKQIDVMFLVTLSSIIIISVLIFGLSRIITRPILDLASAVNHIQQTGKLQEISLSKYDDETSGLQMAINKMIVTLRKQMEEIRLKDERIKRESEREKARLEEEVYALKRRLESHDIHDIEEIVGFGPVIDAWKADIVRAASVDADVLIIGETGSGKQLTAEAIHKHSSRAESPFISINCGALDENLLLDTLFGHVRGAFTEAKADRKGAFLAADGGTLFLDEIGMASHRVQQSLLRAISMRKIKPLGSDGEINVNVRLITATNVDLKELIQQGVFRQDLYYRLEVLTIRPPSLRDHKENIPVLVRYFLKQADRLMNKEDVGLSRGALEKMKNYHWPGNIRELMNCVTRAVAMAEGKLIYADDLRLGGLDEPVIEPYQSQAVRAEPPPIRESESIPAELNVRQRKAFPFILRKGEITRSEYQSVTGNNLPPRTALYDLQDLVKRGYLKKMGRGPATRYCLAKLPDSAG